MVPKARSFPSIRENFQLWKTELGELHRFRKLPPQQRQIIIYAEHEGYYPYFEGIIQELVKRGQPLCYITSDPHDPALSCKNDKLKTPPNIFFSFYCKKLLPFFMLFVNCKVFVMTLTDLNKYHLKRSINAVHYVYIFHALVSTHMMYLKGAFDHYDSILCVGPHQIQEIRKYEQQQALPPKRLVEAGYYRLEKIMHAAQERKKQQETHTIKEHTFTEKKTGDRIRHNRVPTILIAPSWGKENVLESCGERLIRLLLNEGYNVIVRPHPETVRRTPHLLRQFQSSFGYDNRFVLELSVASDNSLLAADVLISDCSGVMLEYAFGTERPILSLEAPPKVKNPDYSMLGLEPIELALRPKIGKVIPLEEVENVSQHIRDLLQRQNEYREEIVRLRNQYVFHLGKSPVIGAEYIRGLLNTGMQINPCVNNAKVQQIL